MAFKLFPNAVSRQLMVYFHIKINSDKTTRKLLAHDSESTPPLSESESEQKKTPYPQLNTLLILGITFKNSVCTV